MQRIKRILKALFVYTPPAGGTTNGEAVFLMTFIIAMSATMSWCAFVVVGWLFIITPFDQPLTQWTAVAMVMEGLGLLSLATAVMITIILIHMIQRTYYSWWINR